MSISSSMTCPHCNKPFDLTEALSHDLDATVNERVNSELKTLNEEFKKRLSKAESERLETVRSMEAEKLELKLKIEKDLTAKMSEKYGLENKDLKNQLLEASKATQDFQAKELELRKQTRELEKKAKEMEKECLPEDLTWDMGLQILLGKLSCPLNER